MNLALTALLLAASAAGEAPSGDLARLQGRWVAKAGPDQDIVVTLDVEGRKARVKIALPQGIEIKAKGELKIDEKASPRALDWVNFDGPDGGTLPDIAAIYAIDGKTFKVCNAGPNDPRPAEFKAGDGILAAVVTFERPAAPPGRK